jgi:hypothetical protein
MLLTHAQHPGEGMEMNTTTPLMDARAADVDVAIERRHATEVLLLSAAAAVAAIVAAIDLLTYHVNLPIVYIVPLLLVEPLARRKLLWQTAAAFVILTFAGYFFGNLPPSARGLPDFASARLVNRIMSAMTILTAAAMLSLHLSVRERRAQQRRREWPHDPDGTNFQRAILSLDRILAPLLAGILTVALFFCDIVAAPDYNVALLYGLPLVILARTRSGPIIWTGLPLLMAAALGGLWLGAPLDDPAHLPNLLLNRALTCAAMLGATLTLHAQLRRS